MTKKRILECQKIVVDEVERLSKDRKYLEKNTDPDHKEKVDPFVVALLANETNEILSVRSEMMKGDHAEYNLFMNKLEGLDHSDYILFVSLEPCNHDSRLTTISCSELIVKAGIKKVYMGMFDPDAMVRGDGYCYLVHEKVEVELFEPEYQAKLIEINSNFYMSKVQSKEDYTRFAKKQKPFIDIRSIALYEMLRDNVKAESITDEGISDYISNHGDLLEELFNSCLEDGFISNIIINGKRDYWIDDGFKLVFYKNPNAFFKGASIQIVDKTKSENPSTSFKGPLFQQIIDANKSIGDILKTIAEAKHIEKIKDIVRELIANAVCHKNYNSYTPIIIKITKDDIEISNPFIDKKVDVGELNAYSMPTNYVNGGLSELARRVHILEGQGRGSEDLQKYIKHFGQGKTPYKSVSDILLVKIPVIKPKSNDSKKGKTSAKNKDDK